MNRIESRTCTEGIKYAGSKLKLLPYILEQASLLPGVKKVLDGFSGTTRVSQAFAQQGYAVTSNDASDWSEVFARCYLQSSQTDEYYQKILNHLNALPGKDGWFSQHYGGGEHDLKKPFRLKNTQKLDAIRQEIDRLHLPQNDKAVLLASLILALDKVDSTLGHYASYLSKWSARSSKDLFLQLPARFTHTGGHEVLKEDIFNAIESRRWDLAYFDPPYGSNNEKMPPSRVRYASYYHLWTTVVRNDQPELFGAAARRVDSKDAQAGSVFEEFRKNDAGRFIALDALDKLLNKTDARYIMLSYSSGGRATKRELLDCLAQNGKLLRFLEIDYKKNVMAEMSWTGEWVNRSQNFEYLFILEKGA